MHPADIQAELRKRGLMQKDVAKALGVSPKTISAEIHGRPVSERIRTAIAAELGRTPQEVFPDYYQARAEKQRRKWAWIRRVTRYLCRSNRKN